MTEYKKLANQPLELVLAEFRFSKVLQIEEYIPRLQEALRKKYPMLKKSSEQSIHVQADKFEVSSINRWSFASADKKHAVDINQDRLVYFTTAYPRFEGFADECQEALQKVTEIVEPGLLLRIGLRYCDLITPTEDESFEQLVDKKFIPTSSTEGVGQSRHLKTENLIDTAIGRLSIRSWYGEMPLVCPPDIIGVPVHIRQNQEPTTRLLLDFDHIWESGEESVTFNTEQALVRLSQLHDASRKAFWNVTTDYARDDKWS